MLAWATGVRRRAGGEGVGRAVEEGVHLEEQPKCSLA